MKTKIFFKANGLGDTIGWMGQAERYQKTTGHQVDVFCQFNHIFGAENINIYPKSHPSVHDAYDQSFAIDYHGWERPSSFTNEVKDIKEGGLIQMASEILGFTEIEEIKPLLRFKLKKIKSKRPIVSLATLSTLQQKFWNYKGGWNEVISYLKQKKIDVVSLDQHSKFGAGFAHKDFLPLNPIPSRSIDKTGGSLRMVASYIDRSLFFMGLGSGIAWLAWALGKPVVMVNGFVRESYHWTEGMYYVQNTNVCNCCWSNHQLERYDWYWCPENQDFICSRQITPKMVIEKIDLILHS